ncbi:nuclear polyadenylated RNA-binding protein 3 [Neophaeococcomyces mojaviensis]|uniref:Nuclear polyadenylated RNA-binding protein 3 n=1 Tax=Neophaeococcomyces mojaviensis TaxID=3383035 RepID=A0ACC3A296_9EURO|nr:nuclear polyadenylated RNA-binding protein 3 [Knufia sp. JES_112]
MSNNNSPIEQQRFARTQTPESPRPVHVPEPSNIPVLLNQMDPVFNDTNTYNIPSDQTFSPYGESLEHPHYKNPAASEEHDAVQNFFREAERKASEPTATANSNAFAHNTNQAGFYLPTPQTASATSNGAQSLAPSEMNAGLNDENDTTMIGAALPMRDGQPYQEENGSKNIEGSSTSKPAHVEAQSETGVDYQSLLDTISQSTSTAPTAEGITALTTEASISNSHVSSLPSFPGLPKKPPPLETQNAFSPPHTAHFRSQPTSAAIESDASQQNATHGYAPATNEVDSSNLGSAIGSEGIPTNLFDVAMTNEQAVALHMQYAQQNQLNARPSPPGRVEMDPADRPWSPRTQNMYDQFLEDERRYVTEGIWDRFPVGSRLFVGNLPSEKVTKRDLFHWFHRHGKLAQISIKQAYGFVQYHEAEACKAALDAEQGIEIRGRKVHLEISKPQKNTKGAGTNKNQNRRRSRSPQRRSYSDFRDEPGRRREEYRSRRSPSPRGHRRDEHRDSNVGRDERRSPMYASNYGTPQPAAFDDEASLPFPRRDPRNVPDVQLIVLDGGVHQSFINWIEDGFRRKGLSAATTWLNQRAPLAAVVKRQIVEGVQAVVKLGSSAQSRSKIPLQVFDRSSGSSNVSFNEYVDLEVAVAADVVLQARQKERGGLVGGMQPPRPPFPPALMPPQSPYSSYQSSPATPWGPAPPPQQHIPPHPQFPTTPQQHHPPPPPQHYQYPPQHHTYRPPQPSQSQTPYSSGPPSATGSQPPNLHELLANLNKGGIGTGAPPTPLSAHSVATPHTPYGPPQPHFQQPQAPYLQVPVPPHHQPQQPQLGGYGQQQAWGQQGQLAQNGVGQQNVQNMLEQLNRFRQ